MPDTHASIVQASAFRLIRMLQKNYPEIHSLGGTIDSATNASAASAAALTEARLAQGSLLVYLTHVINPMKHPLFAEEIAAARMNSTICGSMEMIEAIRALPPSRFLDEDKKDVFKEMLTIASIYPSQATWSENTQHWSINNFFNASTQQTESLITSPAEAQNLVCRALLDDTYYISGKEEDKQHRIVTFYTHLKSLMNKKKTGQLEKCSAGLQHDLLFLLNKIYLDKSLVEEGRPIDLPMEMAAFIKESLSLFIQDELMKQEEAPQTQAMIMDWMRWQGAITQDESPLILWLRIQYPTPQQVDSGWKSLAAAHLEESYQKFGLNPKNAEILMCLEELSSVAIPALKQTIAPLVADILKLNDLPLLQETAADSQLAQLIKFRNQAIQQLKIHLTETDLDSVQRHAAKLSLLFSALDSVASLHQNRTVNFGEKDEQFYKAGQELSLLLLPYFQDYNLETSQLNLEDFELLRYNYLKHKLTFLNKNFINFIENFFASIYSTRSSWRGYWGRLIELKYKEESPHPLYLTDEALISWRGQQDGLEGNLDISPYEVNRILLHGLMLLPRQWSPLYCQYIKQVIQWLAKPSLEDEPYTLKTFKKSYSPVLLANLSLITLIQSSHVDQEIKSSLLPNMESWEKFNNMLEESLLSRVLNLNNAELSQFLEQMGALIELGKLIESASQLQRIFFLSPEQLNETQRGQIWNAVHARLEELFQRKYDIYLLLRLSSKQFNEEQRRDLLNLANTSILSQLLNHPQSELSEIERGQIWSAVEKRLGALFLTGDNLFAFLSLSSERLNEGERNQILNAIDKAGRLGTLIQDVYQLRSLFALSSQQLNETQRNQILNAIDKAGRLGTLFQNAEQLCCLFALSPQHLNETQHAQIQNAIQRVESEKNLRLSHSLFKQQQSQAPSSDEEPNDKNHPHNK